MVPLGFWSSPRARLRICSKCGLLDWFLTRDALQDARNKFGKGGHFAAPDEQPAFPGRLSIEDDLLVYSLSGSESYQLPIGELRVIGEYTDESAGGPDSVPYDHFLTFLTATDFFDISFKAEGCAAVLEQLGQRFGPGLPLKPKLSYSSSLASRILWPASIEGDPVFDFVPQDLSSKPERRLTDKLLEELQVR